jgi:hypothetical protein
MAVCEATSNVTAQLKKCGEREPLSRGGFAQAFPGWKHYLFTQKAPPPLGDDKKETSENWQNDRDFLITTSHPQVNSYQFLENFS